MKKKTAYIGIILLIAVFTVVILFVNQGTGYIKIDAPGFETDLILQKRNFSLWKRKSISLQGIEPAQIRVGSYRPYYIALRRTEDSGEWWTITTR